MPPLLMAATLYFQPLFGSFSLILHVTSLLFFAFFLFVDSQLDALRRNHAVREQLVAESEEVHSVISSLLLIFYSRCYICLLVIPHRRS